MRGPRVAASSQPSRSSHHRCAPVPLPKPHLCSRKHILQPWTDPTQPPHLRRTISRKPRRSCATSSTTMHPRPPRTKLHPRRKHRVQLPAAAATVARVINRHSASAQRPPPLLRMLLPAPLVLALPLRPLSSEQQVLRRRSHSAQVLLRLPTRLPAVVRMAVLCRRGRSAPLVWGLVPLRMRRLPVDLMEAALLRRLSASARSRRLRSRSASVQKHPLQQPHRTEEEEPAAAVVLLHRRRRSASARARCR